MSSFTSVHTKLTQVVLPVAFAGFLALSGHVMAADVDVAAAEALAKKSNCLKCHSVDKKKDGPAYRDVAAKFKGMPDAEAKLTHHITSGEKVKFPDGHEEEHKKIKTKDPAEIKNLLAWILSLEGGTKY